MGDVFGFSGPNGAGKSPTIQVDDGADLSHDWERRES